MMSENSTFHEVLVRWNFDGWFYPGMVKVKNGESGSGKFTVDTRDGVLHCKPMEEIVFRKINTQSFLVLRDSCYPISQNEYSELAAYINEREKRAKGLLVLALKPKEGLYYKARRRSTSSVSVDESSSSVGFDCAGFPLMKGDSVIAPFLGSSRPSYCISKVFGISKEKDLDLVFQTGSMKSHVPAGLCYWLRRDHYSIVVEVISTRKGKDYLKVPDTNKTDSELRL